MSTVIQLRRDLLANWELANPVLGEGEKVIILSPSGEAIGSKIGDGNNFFVDLPYYFDKTSSVKQVGGVVQDVNGGSVVAKGSVISMNYQTDTVSRTFGTSWAVGQTWNTVTKKAGSNILLIWRVPFRNDSTSWGGGYIDIQISLNGGAFTSIGDSGYDGGVMITTSAIGSMSGTNYLDLPAVRSATSIQVRFLYHSYDGTVWINGNHAINGGSLNAFFSNITIMEIGA